MSMLKEGGFLQFSQRNDFVVIQYIWCFYILDCTYFIVLLHQVIVKERKIEIKPSTGNLCVGLINWLTWWTEKLIPCVRKYRCTTPVGEQRLVSPYLLPTQPIRMHTDNTPPFQCQLCSKNKLVNFINKQEVIISHNVSDIFKYGFLTKQDLK